MDRYAALPSLHFGWDLLVGLTLARFHPRTVVRVLGALMPVAMALAVVDDGESLRARRDRRRHGGDGRARARDAARAGARAALAGAAAGRSRTRGRVVDAPLLIAHRAGNDPARLRAAEGAGADVIEADLHLRRGRLELRHLKTVGPLPLYWDRWALAPPWRRFDTLDDLLAAARAETVLMLDIKGSDHAASRLVTATLDRAARRARVFVSAREWPLLDEIDPVLGQRIASAATPRQLERLIAHASKRSFDGAARASTAARERASARPAGTHPVADVVARQPRPRGRSCNGARRRRPDQRQPRVARRGCGSYARRRLARRASRKAPRKASVRNVIISASMPTARLMSVTPTCKPTPKAMTLAADAVLRRA